MLFLSSSLSVTQVIYPLIGLSESRGKCLAAKKLLADSIDPSQSKKEERLKQLIDTENSFEAIAHEWHGFVA